MGGFVCLFDPRHAQVKRRLREADYFAHDHVIVSYNGDLRGIVEDALQKQRRVRCSVSSFASLGAVIDGTTLLATVPSIVARQIRAVRPHLSTRPLPFELRGAFTELLWPAATDDDEACGYLREQIARIAEAETADL
jgi:LysR family transcriptional activator of mexEF-oprN operon